MMSGGAASFIVTGCILATALSVLAALAGRGGDRWTWLGIAVALALFAANKAFGIQAMVVTHTEAMARDGGWYAGRRGPQGMVVAVLALLEVSLLVGLVVVARRLSGATRVALAVTTLLVLYALLGLVSLHAWDRLVSQPVAGTPLYVFIELIGPAFVGLCAVAALARFVSTGGEEGARQVLIGAFFLGWMLLPVAAYPPISDQMAILGTALPSVTLVTKAAMLPLALLIVSLFVSAENWRRWRPHWLDLVMLLFCAAPLLHWRTLDALYLAAAWLSSWLLGRVLLAGREGRRSALALAAITGLLLLPVALVEGVATPWLYTAVYGPHPFQTVGAERYIGFRPMGFFEDGNQYGIWTAMAALAAIELARTDRGWRWIAGLLVAISLASQSAGAVALLLVGAAVLILRPRWPRWLLPATAAALLASGGIYMSGIVPLEHIARDTRPGQMVLGAFSSLGRRSLPWRISQDQRAIPLIVQHPVIGYGTWDWWRPLDRRPWGLPMLVIGQYGVLGLGLLAVALFAGALATLWRGVRDERFALAILVLLAAVDATLNSTIYFPAVLFAGAMVGMGTAGRRAWL